jgi:putative copper resistance protein D
MAALPVVQLDRETVIAVLGATPLGTVLSIRLAALALVVLAALLRLPTFLVALPAAVALATAAWTGHAGATEGAAGSLHRLADIVHLLAAGTWLGALAMLLASVLGPSDPQELEHRLAAFASTGTAIVVLLLATGIANALFIAGWPFPLASTWTLLLGVKLALFTGMLSLAALNRWRLTPALRAEDPAARRALRLSLASEAGAGLAVVAVVAALGVLDPAA